MGRSKIIRWPAFVVDQARSWAKQRVHQPTIQISRHVFCVSLRTKERAREAVRSRRRRDSNKQIATRKGEMGKSRSGRNGDACDGRRPIMERIDRIEAMSTAGFRGERCRGPIDDREKRRRSQDSGRTKNRSAGETKARSWTQGTEEVRESGLRQTEEQEPTKRWAGRCNKRGSRRRSRAGDRLALLAETET